jgi:hypothetical protein
MPDNVCPVRDDGQENAIPGLRCPAAAYAGGTYPGREPAMGWVIGIAVVLIVVWGTRRLTRGRRSPVIDQSRLENANYSRIGQDVHNAEVRFDGM